MVDNTTEKLRDEMNKALTKDGYKEVLLIGHSHGGIKASAALDGVYPWLKDKIKVIAYGSANIKPFFGADTSVNIHRDGDFVSSLAGINIIKEFFIQRLCIKSSAKIKEVMLNS